MANTTGDATLEARRRTIALRKYQLEEELPFLRVQNTQLRATHARSLRRKRRIARLVERLKQLEDEHEAQSSRHQKTMSVVVSFLLDPNGKPEGWDGYDALNQLRVLLD